MIGRSEPPGGKATATTVHFTNSAGYGDNKVLVSW